MIDFKSNPYEVIGSIELDLVDGEIVAHLNIPSTEHFKNFILKVLNDAKEMNDFSRVILENPLSEGREKIKIQIIEGLKDGLFIKTNLTYIELVVVAGLIIPTLLNDSTEKLKWKLEIK